MQTAKAKTSEIPDEPLQDIVIINVIPLFRTIKTALLLADQLIFKRIRDQFRSFRSDMDSLANLRWSLS